MTAHYTDDTVSLAINVVGLPAAQGSKRFVGNGVMVESSKRVKPWRQDVIAAACAALPDGEAVHFNGAVVVHAEFFLPRPRAHFRSGKNARLLRDAAPRCYVAKKPDADKLLRSTFDALTESGVWRDDAQVVRLMTSKLYADRRPPGAELVIEAVDA